MILKGNVVPYNREFPTPAQYGPNRRGPQPRDLASHRGISREMVNSPGNLAAQPEHSPGNVASQAAAPGEFTRRFPGFHFPVYFRETQFPGNAFPGKPWLAATPPGNSTGNGGEFSAKYGATCQILSVMPILRLSCITSVARLGF